MVLFLNHVEKGYSFKKKSYKKPWTCCKYKERGKRPYTKKRRGMTLNLFSLYKKELKTEVTVLYPIITYPNWAGLVKTSKDCSRTYDQNNSA